MTLATEGGTMMGNALPNTIDDVRKHQRQCLALCSGALVALLAAGVGWIAVADPTLKGVFAISTVVFAVAGLRFAVEVAWDSSEIRLERQRREYLAAIRPQLFAESHDPSVDIQTAPPRS